MTSAIVAVIVLAAAPRTPSAEPQFRFQNNFWVNLHHVVRGDARRGPLKLPLTVKAEELNDQERAAWTTALEAYSPIANRDLVRDQGLIGINNALTQVTSEETLTAPSLEPGIAAALTRAAPVYRAHGWTQQKKINDDWIAALRPLMDRHAAAMAAAIAKVYRVDWPDRPIIVDAAAEAGPGGGYTTFGPPGTAAHTVIAAADPGYQGEMAFEMVFHEASHAQAFAVFVIVDAAAKKQQVTPPRDLSHVLLFYTAGELARRELGKAGDASYRPYADRYGVYDHGWRTLRDAVAKHWQPYLDGQTDMDTALANVVREAVRAGGD